MIASGSQIRGCALWIIVCATAASAQVTEVVRPEPKAKNTHEASKAFLFAASLQTAPADTTSQVFGLDCLPVCDACWLGGPFDHGCPPDWYNDGLCDCGCQFSDTPDCGGSCTCPAVCDWCWCNTNAQNNCPPSWYGDNECDCGCSPPDSDCSGPVTTGACCLPNDDCTIVSPTACANAVGAYRGNNSTCQQANCAARCAAICDYCWTGSPAENQCLPEWEGDGDCDCGCQFGPDPDCGPEGACCAPVNGLCGSLTEATCEDYAAGVFHGVGIACGQVNCDRCDAGCDWCWMDTIAEHACEPGWASDADCDCGCQFSDSACAANVCGNLTCTETAASCPDDCKDLRALASFQNCFRDAPPMTQACVGHSYGDPAGIDLKDFRAFVTLLSGP